MYVMRISIVLPNASTAEHQRMMRRTQKSAHTNWQLIIVPIYCNKNYLLGFIEMKRLLERVRRYILGETAAEEEIRVRNMVIMKLKALDDLIILKSIVDGSTEKPTKTTFWSLLR